MCAGFHDSALREKQDNICMFRNLQVVSDEQRRGVFAKAIQGG